MTGRTLRYLLLAGACVSATPAAADTLKEALTKSYYDNPTLEAARANQRATDENVVIERADALPSASGTATVTEFLYDSDSGQGPDRQFTSQASLSMPIYSGGATRNSIRAAQTRVLAGRADLRGIIWDWASDPDPVTQSTRTVDIPAPDAEIPPEQRIGPVL